MQAKQRAIRYNNRSRRMSEINPPTQSTNATTSSNQSHLEQKLQLLSSRELPNLPHEYFKEARRAGDKYMREHPQLDISSNINDYNRVVEEMNRFIRNAASFRELTGGSDYESTPPPADNTNNNVIMSSPNRGLTAQFNNMPGSGSTNISNNNTQSSTQ